MVVPKNCIGLCMGNISFFKNSSKILFWMIEKRIRNISHSLKECSYCYKFLVLLVSMEKSMLYIHIIERQGNWVCLLSVFLFNGIDNFFHFYKAKYYLKNLMGQYLYYRGDFLSVKKSQVWQLSKAIYLESLVLK